MSVPFGDDKEEEEDSDVESITRTVARGGR